MPLRPLPLFALCAAALCASSVRAQAEPHMEIADGHIHIVTQPGKMVSRPCPCTNRREGRLYSATRRSRLERGMAAIRPLERRHTHRDTQTDTQGHTSCLSTSLSRAHANTHKHTQTHTQRLTTPHTKIARTIAALSCFPHTHTSTNAHDPSQTPHALQTTFTGSDGSPQSLQAMADTLDKTLPMSAVSAMISVRVSIALS